MSVVVSFQPSEAPKPKRNLRPTRCKDGMLFGSPLLFPISPCGAELYAKRAPFSGLIHMINVRLPSLKFSEVLDAMSYQCLSSMSKPSIFSLRGYDSAVERNPLNNITVVSTGQ